MSVMAEGFHFLRSTPHARDPERCVFDNWFYAFDENRDESPISTPAGPRQRGDLMAHEVVEYGDKSVGYGMDQYLSVTTGQQLGFRPRGFKGVYLSGQEARVRRFHEVIDSYIGIDDLITSA